MFPAIAQRGPLLPLKKYFPKVAKGHTRKGWGKLIFKLDSRYFADIAQFIRRYYPSEPLPAKDLVQVWSNSIKVPERQSGTVRGRNGVLRVRGSCRKTTTMTTVSSGSCRALFEGSTGVRDLEGIFWENSVKNLLKKSVLNRGVFNY